jgi:membrane protein YqaA with SNARE-associated domain
MLRRLYDYVILLAETPHALWALAFVSFVESSVFPIPPHVMLIPMVIARPDRWALIAGVCAGASVAGGVAGYALGAFAFDAIGLPVLEFYGYDEKFESFSVRYNEFGAWAVLVGGLTPFPFKIITILSGATGLSFAVFLVSSIIARGAIFFVVAGLLRLIGPPIREFIERRLGLMAALFVILLFGGFVAAKYVL